MVRPVWEGGGAIGDRFRVPLSNRGAEIAYSRAELGGLPGWLDVSGCSTGGCGSLSEVIVTMKMVIMMMIMMKITMMVAVGGRDGRRDGWS